MSKISDDRLEMVLKACLANGPPEIGGWKFKAQNVTFHDIYMIATELQSLRSQAGVSEAVAWQRRLKFDSRNMNRPGQWEQCTGKEATDHWDRLHSHEYRPLYARPIPIEVTEDQTLIQEVEGYLVRIAEMEEVDAALDPTHAIRVAGAARRLILSKAKSQQEGETE